MRKKLFICLLALSANIMAATPGTAGQTITGDYVIIVNTNSNFTQTQSTGNIVFDSSNSGTLVGATATPTPVPNTTPVTLTNTLTPATAITTYTMGTVKTWRENNYVCIGIGTHCYIWMEQNLKADYDAAGKTTTIAQEMMSVYQSKPYQTLNDMADGRIPYKDNSGKLSILLEQTGGSSGYFGGEDDVTAIHIKASSANEYTNGSLSGTNGLLVHEGQHALFNILCCGGDAWLANNFTWFNEGLSVTSMDYTWGGTDPTGWLERINGDVNLRNGSALLYEDYRKTTAQDYSLPYLFVRYLANQKAGKYAPMAFMKSVYKVSAVGKTSEQFVNAVLTQAGLKSAGGGSLTFAEALTNFYVAAFTQEKYGIYGFNADATVWKKVNDYPVYMGESGKSVQLAGSASIVVKTLNGKFKVPADGGANIKYFAVSKPSSQSFEPATGKGTEINPYVIHNAEELNTIGSFPNAHFVLANDIDMSEYFYFTADNFNGSIDGKGFSINELKKTLITTNFGTIKNLHVNATFNDDFYMSSGLININHGTLTDCSISGTFSPVMTGTSQYFYPIWGTLVGTNEISGSIYRCYSDANVTFNLPDNNCTIGGLVGQNAGKIKNCYTRGSLNITQNSTANKWLYAGGLVGHVKGNTWNAIFTNNYSSTKIDITAPSVNITQNVGRIYGKENTNSSVTNCYGLDGMAMSGSLMSVTNANSRTDTELKTQTTFTNWDFESIWEMETADYPVFTSPDNITSITASVNPTDFFIGEKLYFWFSSLTINGTAQADLTMDMIDQSTFDNSTIGEKTITGYYRGKSFTFKVNVKEPTSVSDLTIKEPGITDYIIGQSYTDKGVILTAKINGSVTPSTLYNGFSHNKPNALTTIDNSVTFTYYGADVSQPITVGNKKVSSITILSYPTKSSYAVGDQLDFAGMTMQLSYTDGSKSSILSAKDMADNDLHISKYQDEITTAFNTTSNLEATDNGAVFYIYAGNTLPSDGGINAYIFEITVGNPMVFANQTVYLTVNKECYANTEDIIGGSEDFTTVKKSGNIPDGITPTLPGDWGLTSFSFEGTATTLGTYTVVYTITDNVSNQKLDVTITIIVQNISNKADFASFKLLKNQNTGLTQDILGSINTENKTVTLKVPQGTNITNLMPSYTLVYGANTNTNRWNGNRFDFTTPIEYEITAEDGVTTKTYTVSVEIDTKIEQTEFSKTKIYVTEGVMRIEGIEANTQISLLNLNGQTLLNTTASDAVFTAALKNKGVYLVKTNNLWHKIVW